ncbi:alpha/beta fold hydrolase [Streptomyces vinaceus]|uniref:alpha/beta fold hydrolase n=1 Tax=Streptomyces vinaceus TaxID=1960 RepID=UPI003814268F
MTAASETGSSLPRPRPAGRRPARPRAGAPAALLRHPATDTPADHAVWRRAIEADLKAGFTVVAYDRRGHGASGSPPGQGTRRRDDLAALIESLGDAPVHVAGNSFGASAVLGLAARRPRLFRTIAVHEPPLIGVVTSDPAVLARLQPTMTSVDAVLDLDGLSGCTVPVMLSRGRRARRSSRPCSTGWPRSCRGPGVPPSTARVTCRT